MFKPLFKYKGGKYEEYKKFNNFLPKTINNYYEPFFGSGGVFFRLQNENKIKGSSFINDYSKSLMDFYSSVTHDGFAAELSRLSNKWNDIRNFADAFAKKYGQDFFDCITINKDKTNDFLDNEKLKFLYNKVSDLEKNFNFHGFSLINSIIKSLNDKCSRFRKKSISLSETDVAYNSITTAICQAFYFIIRDMYNDWNNHGHGKEYAQDERSAQWFFIREYCFGSMFRFGPKGDFNVPYGGLSYNGKCFERKIEKLVEPEIKHLFRGVHMYNDDFGASISKWDFNQNDFMFLDPPYDSKFTDYDNNGFGKKEHIRLKETLQKCNCNWLMAIGKTDFIADLYKEYNIAEYDKTYMYQARGEYDSKHTTHLVITNYSL